MDLQAISNQLEPIGRILTIMSLLISAFLIYTKLVIERGLFPPVEFYLKWIVHGEQKNRIIIEILPVLENKGTSILIVKNLRIEVRYLLREDPIRFFPNFRGRLDFSRSLEDDLYLDDSGRFQVLPHDTFIKPGVKQTYSFITFIPNEASYVLLHSTFDYDKRTSLLQRYSLNLARHLGLINYTLENIFEPHSSEASFKIEIDKTHDGNIGFENKKNNT